MNANRLVKWSDDAVNFFAQAEDNGIVLDIVISHGCVSQTGDGFEDLVNSINSEEVKRKVKKVNILDTSYLYRHVIPDFSRHADTSIPTIWFLTNKCSIEKLALDVEVRSWADGIDSDIFKHWHEKIIRDFAGDEKGNGIVREFRENVIADAAVAVYKGNGSLEDCKNFILEECAYVCAHLRDSVIIYPMPFYNSIKNVIERYNLNVSYYSYKPSSYSRKRNNSCNHAKINKEVIFFLTENLNANFFVIDNTGNYIYKNSKLTEIVGETPADIVEPESWKASLQVMKNGKQTAVEERYKEKHYYSIKAPLIIDGEIVGIIGAAIDITDRKKAEQLELQNKLQAAKLVDQEEFRQFTSQLAHDVASPLAVLELIMHSWKNLSEKQHIMLRNVITDIKNISEALLSKYKQQSRLRGNCTERKQHVLVPLTLEEAIWNKRYEYKNKDIDIRYSYNPSFILTFIEGNKCDFCRMISNLINNSVEAVEGRSGIVEIALEIDERFVKVHIKDNGKGMPHEMVDKILGNVRVGTTKASGYGIGLEQVKNTLKFCNGKMSIESTEGAGTTIILTFPLSKAPDWIVDKIILSKGNTIVILDDDENVHNIWKERLSIHSEDLNLKFFTTGEDALEFLKSASQCEKNKLFVLSDYGLRGEKSGLQIIQETEMEARSVIVTSINNDKTVQDFIQKSGIKILPKQFLKNIEIIMK
ncbi:MAG: PAS domain-containing sensor histidine kinase [Holosporaceae bacterium]|jgi:PAS domain S-box-containing protein|nr:PAS domain-containing sensor histidine kinase [Holosporaceae bacterium]